MPQLADYPEKEQVRALALHRIFQQAENAIDKGARIQATLKSASEKNHGMELRLSDGTSFMLDFAWGDSAGNGATVRRWWDRWKQNQSPVSCVRQYRPAKMKDIPDDVARELNRLATLKGVRNNSAGIAEMKRRWAAGERLVPDAGGTGDWREWWALHHASKPVPASAPAFPWSSNLLYKILPKKNSPVKKIGTEGVFSGRNALKHMVRNSACLAPGQLYTADDVELEIVCLYGDPGYTTKLKVYVMMEWGTRRVVAYTLRPGDGLLERDVRNLILRGLRVCGLCAVGPTHIILERGSLALSPRSIADFELYLDGRVIIHRTEMIRGRSWLGAAPDASSGNPRGKAIVESLAKKIHELTKMLPGQRGNKYGIQPANLGFVGQRSRPEKGSVSAEAEALAALMFASGGRLHLEFPLLWANEVHAALGEIFIAYNAQRGHQMQGFHHVTQQWSDQIQNWKDVTC